MFLSRLLLVLLFVGSIAWAKDRPANQSQSVKPHSRANTAADLDSSVALATPDSIAVLKADDIALPGNRTATKRDLTLSRGDDEICYTMRTYVVARDDKESDATHPVRSTTCQPGSRYRLKTADVDGSEER